MDGESSGGSTDGSDENGGRVQIVGKYRFN